MRAVRRLVAYQLATGWRGWALLALLVGLAGGAVLTAAAGAQRTASAYPRFLAASRASDVLVGPAGSGLGGYDDALARLPGVAAIAPLVGFQAGPLGPGGRIDDQAVVSAPLDGRFGHLLEIPKLLAGRQPMPVRPGELMVDQIAAQDLRLQVGSRLDLAVAAGSGTRHIRRLSERVVGIMVDRGSVVPVTTLDKAPVIVGSIALFRELGPRYQAFDADYVKLRPGVTPSAFGREAQALARRFPGTGGQVFVADEAVQAATIERAIRPQAIALALFAVALALTALLVVGQVAVRLLLAASSDNATLVALGMTRGQLLAAGLAEVGVTAAAGAVLACGVAIAASPVMPIGSARLAEPHPGLSADVAVLAVGSLAIVALLLARVARPAWHYGSAGRSAGGDLAGVPGRRPRLAGWLARAGAPVPAVAGMRLALDPGQERGAMQAPSAILGLATSVAAVVAAVTFGANLLHLVHTPRLYGQDWDVTVDLQFGTITPQRFDAIAARVPGVSSWTFGVHGTVGVGGAVVPAIGLAAGRGQLISPTLLAGRPPGAEHEIVLGTSVLRRTGWHIGQLVPVTSSGHQQISRIVGRAVLPDFGEGAFTPTDLGNGAVVTAGLLAPPVTASNGPGYNFVIVRFAPGPRRATEIARFRQAMGPFCASVQQSTCVLPDQRPNGVTNYARIDGTPEVLAGILAALALAVLGQFVVASARRQRRDFAILQALGMTHSQLSAVTAWQVTTLTGLGLLIGVPLGVAAGHWAWGLFARNLGLSPGAITPMPLIMLMIPVAIIAANTIAFPPGRLSAHRSTAEVLRAE